MALLLTRLLAVFADVLCVERLKRYFCQRSVVDDVALSMWRRCRCGVVVNTALLATLCRYCSSSVRVDVDVLCCTSCCCCRRRGNYLFIRVTIWLSHPFRQPHVAVGGIGVFARRWQHRDRRRRPDSGRPQLQRASVSSPPPLLSKGVHQERGLLDGF